MTTNSEFGTRNAERRDAISRRRSEFVVPSSEFRVPRSAFTLIEVSLVLALLVVLAGLVWPALNGTFAAQQLQSAAEQLRADFTQARVTAMNTGTVQLLTFDPTTGRYAVVPVDDGMSSDPFSLPLDMPAPTAAQLQGRPLPEGITFREVAAIDDATPPPAVAGAQSFGPTPGAAAATGATQSVYFHPDGTTSSARVTLANDRSMYVDVRLRGLTGATSVGEVLVGEMLR